MLAHSGKRIVKGISNNNCAKIVQTGSDTELEITADKKVILSILKDIKVQGQDMQCLYAVVSSIMSLLPTIMSEYVYFEKSKARYKEGDASKFSEQDLELILSGVESRLKREFEEGSLKKEVYDLFMKENFILLKQSVGYVFQSIRSLGVKDYVEVYNNNRNKRNNITEQGFIMQYCLKSEKFKHAIMSLCLFTFAPPVALFKLSIILQVETFDEGSKLSDFMRTTFSKFSDEINKVCLLPEEEVKFLAIKLFEKHKYVYLCDDLSVISFSKAIEPLCLSIKSIKENSPQRLFLMGMAVDNLSREFKEIEIEVIRRCRSRLSLGLIKWGNIASNLEGVDLSAKLACQLERDLYKRTHKLKVEKGNCDALVQSISSKELSNVLVASTHVAIKPTLGAVAIVNTITVNDVFDVDIKPQSKGISTIL